jgi:hypothetical protein
MRFVERCRTAYHPSGEDLIVGAEDLRPYQHRKISAENRRNANQRAVLGMDFVNRTLEASKGRCRAQKGYTKLVGQPSAF